MCARICEELSILHTHTCTLFFFLFCVNIHIKTQKPEINLEHSCTQQVIHNKRKINNNNIKSHQAINKAEEERESNITHCLRSCFGWMTVTNQREFTDERDYRVSEGSKVRAFWREMKLGFIIRANTYLGFALWTSTVVGQIDWPSYNICEFFICIRG